MMTGYLAPVGFEKDLETELKLRGIKILETHGRLVLTEGEARDIVFAQDTWKDVAIVDFTSISDGAGKLKERGGRYTHFPLQNIRRGELVLEKLPRAREKKYNFLETIPDKNLSAFSLLSENKLLAARETTCPLPFGEIHFNEDKLNPPSRAYLKLWELFTLYGYKPIAGEQVMDLGACPGGWTWVLASMGCQVLSVDKAPLDPKIMAMPEVKFMQESAFGLRPMHVGAKDWLYSDIICYPHKLLELVNRWRESGLVKNYACTIKFQAPTDFETMFKFMEIPGSKVIHLSCNKHEVTWVNCDQTRAKV